MRQPADLHATLVASWRTNNRVTAYLVEHLPAALWDVSVPGAPRRTMRMTAGHRHNARCSWPSPHVLTYFVAHEGHHRGQIVMLARQLGHRLPASTSAGLWQWTRRVQEVRGARR